MTLKYHFQIAQQDTHGPRNVARIPCSTPRKDHMVCYICKILDWQVLSRILISWVLYLTIFKKNGFGAQHLPTFVWPLNDVLGGGHYRAPMSMSSEFTSSAERGGTRDAKGSALVMARQCTAVVPSTLEVQQQEGRYFRVCLGCLCSNPATDT